MRVRVRGPLGSREAAGRFLMVTVANIGLHGGGLLRFTRALHLDDGLMDVWAFAGETYRDMLSLGGSVFAHRGEHNPGILRLTGDRIELELDEPQVVHVDAEPQSATQRMVIEVVPRRLRLLVPAGAARGLYAGT
jgi:diacylglycerol kinase family enzyme